MKRPKHVFMESQTLDGIASSLVVTPTQIKWNNAQEFLLARFPHIAPDVLKRKIKAGKIYYDDGSSVSADAPLIEGQRFWYFREIENEAEIPFNYEVLYEDDNIIVVDKPHFLSTTPVGRSLKETVVTRIRKATGNMGITPAHRLDRATAGVLLMTKRASVREAYQSLFEQRNTQKIYHAICHTNEELPSKFNIDLHIRENKNNIFVSVLDAPPNSHTEVKLLNSLDGFSHYELKPVTGKKHQLRCHMAHYNASIVNDIWYPTPQNDGPDDFTRPMQLLAYQLSFNDPLSGKSRTFTTKRKLLHDWR